MGVCFTEVVPNVLLAGVGVNRCAGRVSADADVARELAATENTRDGEDDGRAGEEEKREASAGSLAFNAPLPTWGALPKLKPTNTGMTASFLRTCWLRMADAHPPASLTAC